MGDRIFRKEKDFRGIDNFGLVFSGNESRTSSEGGFALILNDIGNPGADVIFDEDNPPGADCVMIDPVDHTRRKTVPAGTDCEDLLVPVFREGKRVYEVPSLEDARRRVREQLAMFHGGVKRFVNPHRYPVGLERSLHERKTELILEARRSREAR